MAQSTSGSPDRRKPWWLPSWALARLDAAYFRAQDRRLLADPDLQESLRQMHAGEVVRPVDCITCPVCGRTSYNPHDVEKGWCGNCHAWTADWTPERIAQQRAADEHTRLSQEIVGDDPPQMRVCTTHRRINICRQGAREGGCVWSTDPADLEDIGKISGKLL